MKMDVYGGLNRGEGREKIGKTIFLTKPNFAR
jgi:hypothetical protein